MTLKISIVMLGAVLSLAGGILGLTNTLGNFILIPIIGGGVIALSGTFWILYIPSSKRGRRG